MPNARHILVVGGSRGIGKVFADTCLEKGWNVSVVSRSGKFPAPGVLSLDADICSEKDIQQFPHEACQKNGPISSLAFFQRARGEGDMWSEHLLVSVKAIDAVVSASLPFFSPSGDKSILIASSIAAIVVAPEQNAAYHASRAAQIGLMRHLAYSLGPRGIRVNSISLGTVLKPENQDFFYTHSKEKKLAESSSPLGRLGEAREVAEASEFLCSERASWITGHNLVCDGGASLALNANP
jgi:NAD(P)-dependent dehydrogenase (short-subunit alcohol dehydrogenase family)